MQARSPSRRPAHRVPIVISGTGRSVWDLIEPAVQEASSCIMRFRQLGSARQHCYHSRQSRCIFRAIDGKTLVSLIGHRRTATFISILKNRSTPAHMPTAERKRTRSSMALRTTYKHRKPFDVEVLSRPHEGYSTGMSSSATKATAAKPTASRRSQSGRGAAHCCLASSRAGCGCRLVVAYSGHYIRRSPCERPIRCWAARCLTFEQARDIAVGRELLLAVAPLAIEAAMHAEHRVMGAAEQQRIVSWAAQARTMRPLRTALRPVTRITPDRRSIREDWEQPLRACRTARRAGGAPEATLFLPRPIRRACRRSRSCLDAPACHAIPQQLVRTSLPTSSSTTSEFARALLASIGGGQHSDPRPKPEPDMDVALLKAVP